MATQPPPDPHEHTVPIPVSVDHETKSPAASFKNRRAHRREVIAQLSWLDNVRVKYGPEVTLLDLSPGGAQIETAGYPLQPGSAIVLEIKAGGKLTSVPAQVVRCQLASLSPIPTYRGSVRFRRPLDFPESFTTAETAGAEWDPTIEYERLNMALDRIPQQQGSSPGAVSIGSLTPLGAEALDTAFAMIELVDDPSQLTPFARSMASLFRAAAQVVGEAAEPDDIIADVVEKLRRSIPTLSVRVVPQGGSERRQDHIVCFQVPTERSQPGARLMVEFAKDCPLEEWHLQLLQGAAQLIGALTTFAPVK